MRMTIHFALLRGVLPGAALLALACCEPPTGTPDDPEPGACDEVWGAVPEGGRIYVDASAEEGGDGSAGAPYAALFAEGTEVDSALEAARQSGIRQVVLAAGEYPGSYLLSGTNALWLDSGIEIAGCGADRTELAAIQAPDPGGDGDVLMPNVDVSGADTRDVVFRDLKLTGGRRSIVVRGGAGRDGPIVFRRVAVEDAVRLGILVDGFATRVHMEDVDVDGVVPEDGVGWGIAVQTGAPLWNPLAAPSVLDGVSVSGAQAAGILADGAWLDMIAVTVAGTAPDAGLGKLGRGVQLQNNCRGMLDGLVLEANSDAALFLHMPGRDGEGVHVRDSVMRATLPAVAGSEQTGDGMVVTQGDAEGSPVAFLAIVEDVEFRENPRSHLLVEGVLVQVGADNIFGKGTDFPFASQGGAVTEGIGGGEPGAPPEELSGADALEIESEPILVDDLAE